MIGILAFLMKRSTSSSPPAISKLRHAAVPVRELAGPCVVRVRLEPG